MAVIAVAGRKGGIGKSTVALNLATASKSPLIDADPQGTAAALGGAVSATGLKLRPKIQELASESRLVWVDLPPRIDPDVKTTLAIADHLLLPCPPEQPAFTALEAMAEELERMGKLEKAIVVLTLVAPQASASYMAMFKEAIEETGLTVANSLIHRRADAANAWGFEGSVINTAPKSKAAAEVKTLWRELKRRWKI